MKKFCIAVALTIATGVVGFAQGVSPTAPQTGPDLSGRWLREPASGGTGTADKSGWGSLVEIKQSGVNVSVQPLSGKLEQYRLDGYETAEVLNVKGCGNITRIVKSVADRDRVTISTWLVVKEACAHGEIDEEPRITDTGVIAVNQVKGRRLSESITVVSRQGDTMTVDTTRSVAGGLPTSTTTTYRK